MFNMKGYIMMKIENIKPDGYVMKGVYTPAKKVDLGDSI